MYPQTYRIMDNVGKLVSRLNYEAQRSRSGDGARHFNLLNHNSHTSPASLAAPQGTADVAPPRADIRQRVKGR